LLLGGVLLSYVFISCQALHAPLCMLDDAAEFAFVRAHPSLSVLWSNDCFFFFRPVKNLCFLAFHALQPFGIESCRLLAIGIGLVAALAVHTFFRRIFSGRPSACLLATACWLLAPTQVSCTVWLSCVNIQAMAGVSAISLWLFMGAGTREGRARVWLLTGASLTCLLAMLSYEGAICLPALVVLVDFFLRPERLRQPRGWRVYAVAVLTAVVYLALRVARAQAPQQIFCQHFGVLPDWQVAVAAPWFFLQHLSIWLWPFGHQAILGGYVAGQVSPALLACAWLCVALLVVAGLLLRRRLTLVGMGLLWCLLAFLPMSNILAFRNGPYGDYYLALAGMGLALAFGGLVVRLQPCGGGARLAGLALLAAILWRAAAAGETVVWSRAWNEPAELLQRTVRTFPRAFSAMNEYARLCYRAGEFGECQAWADRALAIAPRNRDSHELRALAAEQRGDSGAALREVEQFLQCGGANESWGWWFKGYLLDERLGDTNGAIHCYDRAVANRAGWTPDALQAQTALGYFAAQRGDCHKAVRLWEQVLQADPAQQAARQNLVRAYLELGETNHARECMQWNQRANGSTAAGR